MCNQKISQYYYFTYRLNNLQAGLAGKIEIKKKILKLLEYNLFFNEDLLILIYPFSVKDIFTFSPKFDYFSKKNK